MAINTIFSGMNIHKSQLFLCEQKGYKVLDPLPYDVRLTCLKTCTYRNPYKDRNLGCYRFFAHNFCSNLCGVGYII